MQAVMNQIRPSALWKGGFPLQGAPRIAPIAAFVLAVHLALILWLIVAAPAKTFLPKPKARVVVQTVQLSTVKQQTAAYKAEEWSAPVQMPEPQAFEETPQIEMQQMPKLEESKLSSQPKVIEIPQPHIKAPAKPPAKSIEKPKPVPQKVEKKKAVSKKKDKPKEMPKEKAAPKEVPKAKPTPKKASKEKAVPKDGPKEKIAPKEKAVSDAQIAKRAAQKAKQQELLAKAQESIAKIRREGVTIDAKQKADLKIPQLTLATVAADEVTSLSLGESSYRDELAGRLKLLLKLPEYGSVKLKLTLQRSGKVSKVAIVSAGSSQNRAYVEKMMPTLQFPPFGTQFGQEPEYTFTITLNNDF